MQLQRYCGLLGSISGLLACACTHGSAEPVGVAGQDLRIESNRYSKSSKYLKIDLPFPAGVAGGQDVVFVGSPFEGRVAAYSRVTRQPIGELPPPPNGFILPFIIKHLGPGSVAVLDAGGFPSPEPFVPANPSIYEYEYVFHPGAGITAQLVRRVDFTGILVGFAEDAIRLEDGRWLVSDAVLGNIWVAEIDGTVVPGITRQSLDPEDAIAEMAYCSGMPQIEVGGLPFLFAASTLPGVSPLAARDGTLYFYSPCAGGLFSVPIAALSDDRAPHDRAQDIRLVSPKPEEISVEQLLAITFNPFEPRDHHLYAADSLQLRLLQIDTRSGSRRVIADDPVLFDFPSSMGFLPPMGRGMAAPLLVLSNQQHRTVVTNDALDEDVLALPFLATKVDLRSKPAS